MSSLRAVLSLGTNTIRLLVASVEDGVPSIVEHRATGTRLGEGLGDDGALADAAVERTLLVVAELAAAARAHGAALRCIATSAVRRARNGEEFAAHVRAFTGAPLDVLPGAEEARLGFLGATLLRGDDARVALVDVGGGSTECAVGRPRRLERAVSEEIGSVRLTERYPALAGTRGADEARRAVVRARAAARTCLEPVSELRPVDAAVAVAGTPLTLLAVARGVPIDELPVGATLTRATIAGLISRLSDLTLDERKAQPGMIAQRADVIVAGALVLDAALEALDIDASIVERNDLLLGALLEMPA